MASQWFGGPEYQCIELLGTSQEGQLRKKFVRNMALSTRMYGPLLSTRRNSWKQKKLIPYLRPKPVCNSSSTLIFLVL